MNKKIILALLILILVAAGGWWLMKQKKISPIGQKYDTALDSIFFNIYFGMSREAFFDTCWALNKKGNFVQGPNNLSVQHVISSGLGMPVYMNFYPNFSDKGLYQMPVMYNYEAWAPWNKELNSDTLITRIVKMLEEDYNVSFTKDKTKDGRPAYYNYNGPRKILVTTQDEQFVKVLMENERYK